MSLGDGPVNKWFCASESLGGLLKVQVAGCQGRVSDSSGLGWDLEVCISNTFLGKADAAGPGIPLGGPLL